MDTVLSLSDLNVFNDIFLYKCERDLFNLCSAGNKVCVYTHKCLSPVFECYDDNSVVDWA